MQDISWGVSEISQAAGGQGGLGQTLDNLRMTSPLSLPMALESRPQRRSLSVSSWNQTHGEKWGWTTGPVMGRGHWDLKWGLGKFSFLLFFVVSEVRSASAFTKNPCSSTINLVWPGQQDRVECQTRWRRWFEMKPTCVRSCVQVLCESCSWFSSSRRSCRCTSSCSWRETFLARASASALLVSEFSTSTVWVTY